MTLPILKSVVPETSAPLRSATPSGNRWWPANISSSSSEVAGRLSFRALSPASESRVLHAETPRPSNGLSPKGRPRAPVSRVRRSIRRTGSGCRSEGSFSGPLPGGLCGSVRGFRGAEALHTLKTVYGLPTSRSRPALPSEQWRPERGTIAANKDRRPTQPLQRTPEAFSTVVVCEGRRLRGPMVAFKRRTLNGVSVRRLLV